MAAPRIICRLRGLFFAQSFEALAENDCAEICWSEAEANFWQITRLCSLCQVWFSLNIPSKTMLLIINMAMHGFNPNNTNNANNSNYSNYSAIQIMYVGTRIICMELALLWANNASSNLQILTARDVLMKNEHT